MAVVNPLSDPEQPHIAMLIEQAFQGLRRDLGGDEPMPGLRVSHLRVLSHVPAHGISVTDLAAQAGMTKQAMGQFATYLVGAGYLVEDSDPGDRRVRVLNLSPCGREVTRAIGVRMQQVEEQWSQRVGTQRYATFRAVLAELG